MNWKYLRYFPSLDTRSGFVAKTPRGGCLLDLGSWDGATLSHMAQLRPDLKLFAADLCGQPERYPAGCEFQRVDLESEKLRWADGTMDAITCMQLVEHLRGLNNLAQEVSRLLKPGGRVFFETPHPKSLVLSSPRSRAAGSFTLNFYDDTTHVRIVTAGALAVAVRQVGLEVERTGISRNWLFAASYPFFAFRPASRKKFTAFVHWIGWSAFLVARRPD